MTNCIPPPSSKNLSAMIVVCVGTVPRTARPCRMYSTACSAPESSSPHCSFNQATASAITGCVGEKATGDTFGSMSLMVFLKSPMVVDSSSVLAGASPSQKGTVGGAPCASSTSTRPDFPSTLRILHDAFPSRMMSSRLLSTAKSSSRVPTTVPSGSATTVNNAVSGIAPPLVMAARRAPRRARNTPFTRSRCRYAPYRPRLAAMPSDSISTIPSNVVRSKFRYG